MPTIELGNVSVISMVTDPETGLQTRYRANHIDQSVTTMSIPPDRNLLGILQDATNLWSHQSDAPPAWVSCSEDPDLEAILQKHFGCGGRPDEFEVIVTGPALLVPMESGIPNSSSETAPEAPAPEGGEPV